MAWSTPFDLPDRPWWHWAITAVAVALVAWFISRFHKPSSTLIAVTLGVVATLIGVLAIWVWVSTF